MAATPEEKKAAKAKREQERREQEARAAEQARWASLDACEAAVDERLEKQREALWRMEYHLADALRAERDVATKLGRAAAETAASLAAGQHPFYDGENLARMAADLSTAKGARVKLMEAAGIMRSALPGVTPIWPVREV